MVQEIMNEEAMKQFGARLGSFLAGGETIELVGDVGAGKTTLTKGIATGMNISETVQSPSFTISRLYDAPNGLRLAHYDFYRLTDAGIMANDLEETANDASAVTIIEWADIVDNVLPEDRLRITIASPNEMTRSLTLVSSGPISSKLVEKLK